MSKSDSKRQAILESAYRLFRVQGFDGTSMSDITSQVGGSKATLYSHFPSKEELFVECMMAALQNYMSDTLKHLDASRSDPQAALRNFGTSVLNFICSSEQVEVRRLMIAEDKGLEDRCGSTESHLRGSGPVRTTRNSKGHTRTTNWVSGATDV